MLGAARGGAAIVLLSLLAAACTSGADDRGAGAPRDTSSSATVAAPPAAATTSATATSVVATAAATPDPGSAGAVAPVASRDESLRPPAEVYAVCDSVAAVWRSIPRSEVKRADSLVVAREVDDLRDRKRSYPSCTVDASRAEGLDSTMQRRRFWPARGWTDIWRLDADGPDGNVVTYGRGLLRCEVWEQWDGGDDGDSTYVPSSYYGETTVCWRHRMPIGVLDTLHEEP